MARTVGELAALVNPLFADADATGSPSGRMAIRLVFSSLDEEFELLLLFDEVGSIFFNFFQKKKITFLKICFEIFFFFTKRIKNIFLFLFFLF
jgi:hypothetical protein